ncbi:MAG: SpoIIE family protein phosphatase [Oscillospiraceae bacterium]|nr:SpoIIE family protein phosphatase [Oscillospiraceae bacterium]
MIMKEKTRHAPQKITPSAVSLTKETGRNLFFIVCGFVFSGAYGGAAVPMCTALTAALTGLNSICLFIGCLLAYILFSRLGDFLADIIAIPAVFILKAVYEKIRGQALSPKSSALLTAAVYTFAAAVTAFSHELTPMLLPALLFKGILCGTVTFFTVKCADGLRSGEKLEMGIPAAVLYVLVISALSCARAGNLSVGRCIGIFVTLAAGGRFGIGGSAAAGTLAAMGMILGESGGSELGDMVRSCSLIACSGLVSGYFSRKSRTVSSAAFTVSMFVLIVFMERLQWAASLMTDAIAAAALYCLVPDRLYMRFFTCTVRTGSAAVVHRGSCINFAAETLAGIRRNVSEAAEILKKQAAPEADLPAEACLKICSACRNDMFCCKGALHRSRYVFAPMLGKLYTDGFITERELPRAVEGCHRKTELTDFFNNGLRRITMEQRTADLNARIWENASGLLFSSEGLLRSFSGGDGKVCDETLSARVSVILSEYHAHNASAAVFFDNAGRIFISAVFKGSLDDTLESLTDRLSALTDHDLEAPVVCSENGLTSLRWHDAPLYIAELGKAVCCGSEETSGDSSVSFSDGFGNVYFIISDGMGSGKRAALESSITVSLLARLIKSGVVPSAAIHTANLILLSKSGDEVFSTIDLLCINLFTGRADIIKMGAAPTLIKTGGVIKSCESRTLPAGMISPAEPEKRTLFLSDGDSAVMFSDGISESSFPKIRELMLSDGYSPQRCADAAVDYDKSRCSGRHDDRTVLVVKLHKI